MSFAVKVFKFTAPACDDPPFPWPSLFPMYYHHTVDGMDVKIVSKLRILKKGGDVSENVFIKPLLLK
jgi:hypothetical protein